MSAGQSEPAKTDADTVHATIAAIDVFQPFMLF